jgi:Mce-associated membrane protein
MAANRVSRSVNPLLSVAIALVVIAAGSAAWFGWRWYSAAHSSSLHSSQVRDQALQQGELAMENFNTMNYHNVAQGLKLWENSSTGELLRAISTGQSQFISEVRKEKTETTATILDAALTSLNEQAGTAGIMAAVQLDVVPATGSPVTKRTELVGDLQLTTDGWKLSALGQAPQGGNGSTSSP